MKLRLVKLESHTGRVQVLGATSDSFPEWRVCMVLGHHGGLGQVKQGAKSPQNDRDLTGI
jgi:hypothetical protein